MAKKSKRERREGLWSFPSIPGFVSSKFEPGRKHLTDNEMNAVGRRIERKGNPNALAKRIRQENRSRKKYDLL